MTCLLFVNGEVKFGKRGHPKKLLGILGLRYDELTPIVTYKRLQLINKVMTLDKYT